MDYMYIPVNNARVWYSWLSEGYVSFQGENWNSKFISNFLYLCSSLMLNVLGFVQVWEKKNNADFDLDLLALGKTLLSPTQVRDT